MICIDEREEGKPVTSELVRLELPVRYYAYDEAGKGNGRKMLQLLPIYAAGNVHLCGTRPLAVTAGGSRGAAPLHQKLCFHTGQYLVVSDTKTTDRKSVV